MKFIIYFIIIMLPKKFQYQRKQLSGQSRTYLGFISPVNSNSASLGSTITINLPTSVNTALDTLNSVLSFDFAVTNASATATKLKLGNCGAHGLIQSIKVYHGSNLLESINNYGNLVSRLMDFQMNGANSGVQSMIAGITNPTIGQATLTDPAATDLPTTLTLLNNVRTLLNSNVEPAAYGAVNAYTNPTCNLQALCRDGLCLTTASNTNATNCNVIGTGANTSAVTRTFRFQLCLVSLLGSLIEQYLPLYEMTSSPIRLDITFVDSVAKAMLVTADVNSSLSCAFTNIEYIGRFIEMADSTMASIYENNQRPITFCGTQYENYQQSITPGAGLKFTLPIPCKKTNLKSLFSSFRHNNNTYGYQPFSTVYNGINNYQYRIGSHSLPARPITNPTLMFNEAYLAFNSSSIGDLTNGLNVERDAYLLNQSPVVDSTILFSTMSGSFTIGIDLESFTGVQKSGILCGLNTNNDDIYLTIEYSSTTAHVPVTSSFLVDSYGMYDAMFICENGICYKQE